MIGGKFVWDETRMNIGHRESLQTAQRLSFEIARFFLEAFDEEFPLVLKGMSASTEKVIAAWIRWWVVAFRDFKDQNRPMIVAVLQDDFRVAAISEKVAHWLEEGVLGKLTSELCIKLSQKKSASEPFAEVFSAIGATFETRDGSIMVRPKKPVVEKVREMVSAWGMDEMVPWDFDKVERLAGLVFYIVEFLDSRKAIKARWRIMGQLAAQPGVPVGIRFMGKDVIQGLVNILGACDKKEFGGMMRCARGVHPGKGFCAADARAAADCNLTG